jgi:tetratricopeptide (TPR) repeat protein
MKKLSTALLLAICGSLLLAACNGGGKKAVEDNPFFNTEPALKEITASIKKTPDDAALYFARGKMLRKLKQDTLALRDFKMASSLDTNNATYYSAVGDVLFEAKDLDGSITWLSKAIAKNPTDPQAHLKIAKLFLFMQKYDKAFEQINIVMRKDVYNPEAYYLKGMVYKDMKDTGRAISSFQSALQVAPDYRDADVQLGLLYTAKNDTLGIKYLENAYKKDSTDVFPLYARGVYLQNQKRYEEAKQLFRKCIVKNTHYVDAYFNMGYILMQQDSLQKSYNFYDLAVKLQPDNPSAYYDRGVCNELMNKLQDAIADYKNALKLDPKYASPMAALKRLNVAMDK